MKDIFKATNHGESALEHAAGFDGEVLECEFQLDDGFFELGMAIQFFAESLQQLTRFSNVLYCGIFIRASCGR